MDQKFEEYLNNLVNECLQIPAFAILGPEEQKQIRDKLQDHFMTVMFAVVLEQMSDDQTLELQNVDLSSPEGLNKIQLIAASIPGLADAIEERLKKEQDIILETQKIPEVDLNI